MSLLADEPEIASARIEVLSWLLSQQFGFYDSNSELVEGFTRFVAQETDLELRAQRNPSSCVWEARWYNAGRELDEFRKPFCAEEKVDAQLLACAAMINLDTE